jgi:hypothetical protein
MNAMMIVLMVLLGFADRARSATNTVTSLADSGLGSLRQTMADSSAGDSIVCGVAGTITLTSGELVVTRNLAIVGSGASPLAISGNNSARVFYVNTNVNLTLSNLTIANGFSDQGAGVYNSGGELILHRCTLVNNSATGQSGAPYSGNPGNDGCGGAVYNSGILNAIDCAFLANSVLGGTGAMASRPSGPGGAGGDGNGGAIGNSGTLILTSCLLANNFARGGMGGAGGAGAYAPFANPGGPGGTGGYGNGGALFNNGLAFLVNNTFALNGGAGGQGGGGGSGSPPFSQSSSSGNGGNGGNGGAGYSAIYDLNGQCYLTNCTLASNPATAGAGGLGGPPGPWIYPYPPHLGQPGGNGSIGPSGSGLKTTGAYLLNTLLSSNTPGNCIGTLSDGGHNLSSDASCPFFSAGRLTNTNPKLGPLVSDGGPTWTLALLPNSPAIDAGAALGAPNIDQRGIARPQGRGVDIGAYEFQFTVPQITAEKSQVPSSFWLQASGLPNRTYTVQVSTNLPLWFDVTDIITGSNGLGEFLDTNLNDSGARFYRLKLSAP